MDIFDYKDYKVFVKDWVSSQPKNGRGQWSRFGKYLGLSNVQISQIFQANRNLSLEQAYLLSDILQLTPPESEYFKVLIEFQIASNHNYKIYLEQKRLNLKEASKKLINSLPQDDSLDEETKARFYSDWVYSGIRLLCDISEINSAEQISEILGLKEEKVIDVLQFLIRKGLVIKTNTGLEIGPRRIHLDKDSVYAKYIHMNWRLKSLQDLSNNKDTDSLRITVPCTSSLESFEDLKKDIRSCLNRFYKKLPESESNSLQCLCIDLFPIHKNSKNGTN